MAKANSKVAMFLNLAFVLSLLLAISLAEGRLSTHGFGKFATSPSCSTVYGVRSGDICFAIRKAFNLSEKEFSSINPNIDCNNLFVGQWLCVRGTA